jgi:hypothetical protein
LQTVHERLEALGTAVPEISLPAPCVDLSKWAVIACDQFTQDRAYWKRVEALVSGAAADSEPNPSALRLILPEIYLEDGDRAERVRAIHETMRRYIGEGIVVPSRRGCVYIERNTPLHSGRRGLVAEIDLEQYDWAPEAHSLIRATEGTVKERLPPRMDIRRGAPLEIPHIVLLIDDEDDKLLPGLGAAAKKRSALYNTSLLMNSGGVTGWPLDAEDDWRLLAEGLEKLACRAASKYGGRTDRPFLYAVGDGNHSLASAKAVWEEYKKARAGEKNPENHPCRRALVEIENLYDEAISFEPIHRVIFNAEPDEALEVLSQLPGSSVRAAKDRADLVRLVQDREAEKTRLGLIYGNRCLLHESDNQGIATAGLQPVLDAWINSRRTGAALSIDYIHGEEELFRLAGEFHRNGEPPAGRRAVGILLPPVKKNGLFETVARTGPLPRKSFSMGAAVEKRFYLECRRLFE